MVISLNSQCNEIFSRRQSKPCDLPYFSKNPTVASLIFSTSLQRVNMRSKYKGGYKVKIKDSIPSLCLIVNTFFTKGAPITFPVLGNCMF